MDSLHKFLDALTKLAQYSDKLVPLVLSFAVLAAIIVIGMNGGGI